MASKFLIDQAIADANNYGLQVGTPFNNPVGGVDQFATEMEALEAARAGDPVLVNELGGTLEDFYTNRNLTGAATQGKPTDANTRFKVIDDNIDFNNATVQPQGIVNVDAVRNLIANTDVANNLPFTPMGTDIYSMDESVYDVQDAPYGIGPDGKPYRTPRTIQDQNRVLGMTFTEPKQNLLEQILQNSLTANLLKGVGSFAGDFFKGLAPYEYGTSQRYHQNLSPQGRAIANQLYAPGGSLQGYNQISAWGGGPSASLGKRIDTITKTLERQAKKGKQSQTLIDRRDRLRNEQNQLNTAGWNQGAKAKTQGTIQQLNPHEMRNVAETGDAGGNTGAKIVCTMMNERYGFGSFRNKIWMKFHENHGPEYQKGYHTIFLPLVKIAKGEGKLNTAVRKVLEHMGRHVTADMFKIMKGKKRDTLGRIYRAIFEPTCRIIGKIKSALGRG